MDDVKFLLVDDIEENLVALEGLLQRGGLVLHRARSGVEALELLLVHDFALALIDVQMPEMDGFQLAELMRGMERSRHVPIIFVTAGARDYSRVFRGYESGAVDFLFKPIDPGILRHKVDVFFELWQQRRQLALEVRERDRLLGEVAETLRLNEMFLAALGHDLRNPLSAIMTGATLLAERVEDPQMAAVARRILTSGSRMTNMIAQLLDLARARLGGGILVSPDDANLRTMLDRVIGEQREVAGARPIRCETSGDCRGTWDEMRLGQALSNLIGNAIEHGADGTPVTVQVDGHETADVELRVSNQGVIRPELLPTLFEPFRSGRQFDRRREGLGLGLYIVRQIVIAHGGSIEVQSPDADGATTFVIRLPRVSAASLPAADREERPALN